MDDHAIILKISQNMNKILDKDPPVIGILTKSVEEEERPFIGYRELIEPKYLFILQNAAVIPISLYSSEAEMEEIMGKINGLCLPGGYSNIWKLSRTNKVESDYTKAGRKLLEMALKLNKNGTHFPVLGICLGFELMVACIGQDLSLVEPCIKCTNYSTILQFLEEHKDSRILKAFDQTQYSRLQAARLSFNYHSYMVDHAKFKENERLNSFFRVLSTSPSKDNSFHFVSAIEGRQYPFYGFQHHPEWCFHDFYSPKVNVVCSEETKGIGKTIGDFFLKEARKNNRVYGNKNELKKKLVVNAKTHIDSSKGYVYLMNKTNPNKAYCSIF